MPRRRYVHFTDPEGALGIMQTQTLWKSSMVEGVYAVPEGGAFVPGVCHTKHGRPCSRDIAIVFTTDVQPDRFFPEEAIWYLDELPLRSVRLVRMEVAVALLDDRYVVEYPGEWPSERYDPTGLEGLAEDYEGEELEEELEEALETALGFDPETVLGYEADDSYVWIRETWEVDDDDHLVHGRRIAWDTDGSAYALQVEPDLITFTPGNQWNPGHTRALLAHVECNCDKVFELPAARVYRIDESDLEEQERILLEEGPEAFDEYLEQSGQQRPWTAEDVGKYTAHLVDGNHRAAAAVLGGEPFVVVTVGPNYRENVDPDDWL